MADVSIDAFLRENLACPVCKATPLVIEEDRIGCPACARRFTRKDGIWYLLPDYHYDDTSLQTKLASSGESTGEGYDEKAMVPGSPREFIERVTAFELLDLKGGECVLDVGVGTFRNGLYALEKGARLVCGIDLIPGMLKWGQKKVTQRAFESRTSAIVADARFIPFRDGAFDRVISLELIEHIPTEAEMVFKEIFRVLKPGGRAVVNTWSIVTHLTRRHQKNVGFTINGVYYKFYSPGEFRRLFTDIAFTRKELYGHYFVPVVDYSLRKMKLPHSREFSLAMERVVRHRFPWLSLLLGRFLVVKLEK